MYHAGPFQNDMGRMFGSTRFMAPEEFELGARIDERTNVFTMGRTALNFLSGGTLAEHLFRGSQALFRVVARACHPDRAQRFDSLAAFYRAWQAARLSRRYHAAPRRQLRGATMQPTLRPDAPVRGGVAAGRPTQRLWQ